MTRRETKPFGSAGRVLVAVMVLLAVVLAAVPATARAQVSIARGTVCSLEVEKCPAEGQGFHLALVARMDANGKLVAVPALADAVAETGIDPAKFSEATDAQTLSAAASSYLDTLLLATIPLTRRTQRRRAARRALPDSSPACTFSPPSPQPWTAPPTPPFPTW